MNIGNESYKIQDTIMEKGTVKWYSSAEGYGFVEPDSGGDDVFLHHSEVSDEDLEEGDRLIFEIEETRKGLNAANVQLVTEQSDISSRLAIDIWIDPGDADPADLAEFYSALSDLHRAHGGTGIVFRDDETQVLAAEGT